MQGTPDIARSLEELRRQTFMLIERMSVGAVTADDRRAVVDLQRVAYELGAVEAQLRTRTLRAA